MTNFYANVGNAGGIRHPFDRYETPDSVTASLLRRIDLPVKVREPCCGTGRIVGVLEDHLYDVTASDLLEDGVDFLEETEPCESVLTNPPYRDGLAEAFVRKALELSRGPVWMLLRSGTLWGQDRASGLWKDHPVCRLVIVSRRIKFFQADGSRISGQAHDHAWFGWNVEPGPIEWILPEELHDAS